MKYENCGTEMKVEKVVPAESECGAQYVTYRCPDCGYKREEAEY